MKIARRSNYNIDLRKPSGKHKAALNEKPTDYAMILYSQFNLTIQFRRQGQLKIKLIKMFELHERMPEKRYAEYQATIPLNFS